MAGRSTGRTNLLTPSARYSHGGDDHIFVELDTEMSLTANFKAMAITNALADRDLMGIIDICPANASYQVRFDPLVIAPGDLLAELERIEVDVGDATDIVLETNIVEIPVLYNDPWTHETLMRFRSHHQDPDASDLEYAARINNYATVDAFIEAHSSAPWFTSMVGFVAGLPFLFQMVPRDRQLQVPKYLRPRTDTPKQTIGYGGCFTAIYSVRGAGGYQMFGITPGPIYDPTQQHPDFEDFMVFFKPGMIAKFDPIDRATYDRIAAEVEARTFRFKQRPVAFSLGEFLADPDAYNASLLEVLRGS
ncbi:MAG: allophanate hydrolase subunit 1 [Actinomycetia bacterium]|nr:allophanate hydrolase subunit 1 [Actinomycetes bacterium]MCP4224415.1 allophanate hydrolase subunit 1 [Actinomycetes bacterium]MCP5033433.1 allophanate hydrolase subunit 1 [Actinomycetes bacterium]